MVEFKGFIPVSLKKTVIDRLDLLIDSNDRLMKSRASVIETLLDHYILTKGLSQIVEENKKC